MYDELKLFKECPICWETLSKENAKLSNCGHLHCRTCVAKIHECSICRKKIHKPFGISNEAKILGLLSVEEIRDILGYYE